MDHYEDEILGREPEQETHETSQIPDPQPEPQAQEEAIPDAQTVAQPQPEVTLEPEETHTYHNVGTGRKESPFADSPYVMEHQKTEYTPGYTMPGPDVPRTTRKQQRFWRQAVSAVLVLVLVIGSCAVTAAMVNGHWEDRTATLTKALEEKIGQLEQELSTQIQKIENNGNSVSGSPVSVDGLTPGQVYAQNVASTVLVYSETVNRGQTAYSSGSGFILTDDGYVVTNYHVIENGTAFTVVTSDNKEYQAKLVGGDASNDVAVLKIDGVTLQSVTVGSSDALIVGDQVVAIGNPLGELTSTLTVGYVSAKGRYVTTESTTINMLQTDCAINSGNSGGPLFNMKGEVVGITSAKYSGTSSSGATIEGIGFAIPIDDVLALIEDIMEFGYVNSAYLGVEVNNQNEIQAGLPDGAYIAKVTPGYCAEEAGIKAGDYIIELAGYEILTMNDLTRILRRLDPGTTTTVTVLRNGREITLEITLDQRPQDTTVTEPADQMPLPEDGDFEEWYEYFKWFFENEGKP